METHDMEITPDIKEKLKGFLGFQVEAAFRYVPKVFRDNNLSKNLWPVWTLRSKDGISIAKSEDSIGYVEMDKKDTESTKYRTQSGTQRIETLREGIVSVKNFRCENGSIIEYDKTSSYMKISPLEGEPKEKAGADIESLIKMLSAEYQIEIANAINERSTLTSEELLGLE